MHGGDDFDTKLKFLAKQIVWIVVMFLMLPLCLWGIYIGYQYMDDECVRKTPYSIALDLWLIIACAYDFILWFIVMVLLCCRARGRCRRIVMGPLNLINIVWMVIGLWLLVESQIRCQHNELWVMSLVVICITLGVAILISVILCCTKLGLCHKLGRYVSLEDAPYELHPHQAEPLQASNVF